MLTRKQTWRRQSKRIERGDAHDFIYREGVFACPSPPGRTASEPNLSSDSVSVVKGISKLWATSPNFLSSPDQQKLNTVKKRRVKWNLGVRVVLIPTRTEYREANLNDFIWWTSQDYPLFKKSAVEELKRAMEFLNCDGKTAIITLYQPTVDGQHLFFQEFSSASEKKSSQENAPVGGLWSAGLDTDMTSPSQFNVTSKYNDNVKTSSVDSRESKQDFQKPKLSLLPAASIALTLSLRGQGGQGPSRKSTHGDPAGGGLGGGGARRGGGGLGSYSLAEEKELGVAQVHPLALICS